MLVLVFGLAACETFKTAFPRTAAGYRDGGVVGAVQGAASGLLAICRTLDGEEIKVALDLAAADLGATDSLERIRRARLAACRSIGAASLIVDGLAVPVTAAAESGESTME